MDKNLITYEGIKNVIVKKGYKFFTAPFDLNLVGIRTADTTPNIFNDFICFVYVDEEGRQRVFIETATTEPGIFWLNNPENVDGTAILKEGQYRSCWKIGKHKGQYKALVQVGPMTVYRDKDRDSEFDIIPGSEKTGTFGINYHHAREGGVSTQVDKWSAGCQVVNDYNQYLQSLELIDKQVSAGHGDTFSYTLLHEKDFA